MDLMGVASIPSRSWWNWLSSGVSSWCMSFPRVFSASSMKMMQWVKFLERCEMSWNAWKGLCE